MKENKQKFWWLNPKEYGGLEAMIIFFLAIATAVLGLIVYIIKCYCYAE